MKKLAILSMLLSVNLATLVVASNHSNTTLSNATAHNASNATSNASIAGMIVLGAMTAVVVDVSVDANRTQQASVCVAAPTDRWDKKKPDQCRTKNNNHKNKQRYYQPPFRGRSSAGK